MATNTTLGTIRGKIQIDYDGAGVARAITDTDKLEAKAGNTKRAWDNTSKGLLVAGGVIAGGLALATKSAADFEQGLSNIKAVSGGTAQQMQAIRDKALQLGKDTKFSAGEAATAIEELAKAGVSLPDILGGAADAAVALAAAGQISLPEAATIAANAMNQFGLTAKQLPQVADLISGAANASAIDVSEFGLALSQVGAVAHLTGLSFDDTAVAIAELGNAGIKGSDAGTSLKTFFQNLIPQTKQQKALFDELGLTTNGLGNKFFDASGKARSLADISQVLQNAIKGQTKEQQLNTLQTIFGSDALRASAILAEQGATGFNNLATQMGKVKAADVAKTKMDNFNGSLEQMKGSLETAGIQIGTVLLPQLRKLVDGVTSGVNAFANLSPTTQKTIVAVLGAVGAFALLGGAVIKTVQFFTKLNEAIKVIKALTLWTKIAAAATRLWAIAQLLLDAALSPVGLIVLALIAIALAVFLIIKYHKQLWAIIKPIWDAIWSFLKTIGAWFAGPFAGFFVDLWRKIVNIFNGIKNAVVGAFTAIGNALLAVYNTVIKPVVDLFAPLFQAAFGLVVAIIRLAWSIITAIVQVAITLVRAYIEAELKILHAIWTAVWGAIMAVVRPVWAFLVSFITTQINIIRTVVTAVVNALVTAWNASWNFVAGVIRAVWGFIGPYVMAAIGIVQNAIQVGLSVVQSIVSTVMGVVHSVWSTTWGAISAVAQGAANVISAIVRGLINFVAGIFNGLTAIVNKFRAFFDQLHAAASGGTGTLISFISGIPGRILGAIGNLGSALWSKGRDLIQGLINGISSMAGRIRDALVGLLPGPLKKMAGLLGLASPSKLFRKWGVWTVQGFINGISGMVNRLKATMNAVAAVTAAPGSLSGTVAVSGSGGLSDTSTVARDAVRRRPGDPGDGGGDTYVLADFGDGVRQVVRSTVTKDPSLVASATAAGNQTRRWSAPGR